MFISHIASMDVFAYALRKIAPLHESKALSNLVAQRYSSYDSGIGASIESGKATFKELEQYVLKLSGDKQEPATTSGRQEHHEAILNNFLHQ